MSKEFTIDQLKSLMECAAENNLGEFLYETEDTRIRIRGPRLQVPAFSQEPGAQMAQQPIGGQGAAAPQSLPEAPKNPPEEAKCVASPLVGTYYSAAGPDQEPFVHVGKQVKKGDVLFIVESMKVMNEVPAEEDGVVAQILVDDGQAVEFGQPVLRME